LFIDLFTLKKNVVVYSKQNNWVRLQQTKPPRSFTANKKPLRSFMQIKNAVNTYQQPTTANSPVFSRGATDTAGRSTRVLPLKKQTGHSTCPPISMQSSTRQQL